MPRIPRSLIVHAGFSVHKVWRGHNKEWNLKTDAEKIKYLDLMMEEHGNNRPNPVSALCVMSNHTHEVVNIEDKHEFSDQMRRHHARYGQYFNCKHKRSGKVAQDRPRTALLGDDNAEMEVTFYVHANPVRAGVAKDAKDYLWSTHALYAFGKKPFWLTRVKFPSWYVALGKSAKERQRKYRKLFDKYLRSKGMISQPEPYDLFVGPIQWKLHHEEKITAWRRTHSPPEEVA